MRLPWLEALLPAYRLTPRAAALWTIFFALFPLAYIGGFLMETREESPALMTGFKDRAAAIRIAERFAESKGYPVNGWRRFVVAKTNYNLLDYYGRSREAAKAISQVIPGQEIEVLFQSPDQKREFRTDLTLLGQVIGFDFGKSVMGRYESVSFGDGNVTATPSDSERAAANEEAAIESAVKLSDQEAEAMARRSLAELPSMGQAMSLGKPHVSSNEDDATRSEVVWNEVPSGMPGLTLRISVGVRDRQVVAEHVEAKIDSRHREHTHGFHTLFEGLYSLLLTFGAFYAVIRYAKRTLQKEVSHLRTLAIAALFAVCYGTMVYSTGFDQIAVNISGPLFAKVGVFIYISAVVSFLLMGLLVGIGYGSGEGEVREAYPGKLTSLDALLAGRVKSREVGASVLCGAAAAAWLLLLHQIVSLFITGDVQATRNDVLQYTFSRIPWLTLLVGRQYEPLLIAITGLLLPAAFLLRQSKRRKKRFGWLIFFAFGSVLNEAWRYPNLASALLSMLILSAALLVPFFAFDLLAAIVSLSALSFVETLTRLSAVFPSWDDFALSMGGFAACLLAVATYLAWRGGAVDEGEVKPVYAKNLAQRMALQAEVQAAREAQLRLLPQAAPELAGVQFAAACLPARGVGGDFYDFFALDSHRVGIFVAQGDDQGLATALWIALAKGILMHLSQQGFSPAQTLAELEGSLSKLLEDGTSVSFLYAVVDNRRNVVSYARIGSSPRLLIYQKGGAVTLSVMLEEVAALAGRGPNAPDLYEASMQTSSGDVLIFFTKGVTALKGGVLKRREYQWVETLAPLLEKPSEAMQTSLTEVFARHQSRASDDLTAVILTIKESEAAVQEVVA